MESRPSGSRSEKKDGAFFFPFFRDQRPPLQDAAARWRAQSFSVKEGILLFSFFSLIRRLGDEKDPVPPLYMEMEDFSPFSFWGSSEMKQR